MPTTADLLLPYPQGSDDANVPADLQALADRLETILLRIDKLVDDDADPDAGEFVIVDGTGAPAYQALSGDVTATSGGVTAIGASKVITAMLANLAVTAAKIDNATITQGKMANNSIGTAQLIDLNVTAAKLAALAVETAKIVDDAVTQAKIADDAIGTPQLIALAVTAAELATDAVTTTKILDSAVTGSKLDQTTRARASINKTGEKRAGKFIQATEGERVSNVYGALDNGPDVVEDIILPADGLILVWFQARWSREIPGTAFAAIFLNDEQLRVRRSGSNNADKIAAIHNEITFPHLLSSGPFGLVSTDSNINFSIADVTTGQAVGILPTGTAPTVSLAESSSGTAMEEGPGGCCAIFAAAGTYDVSVRYRHSSATGSVWAEDRKLWVESKGWD